MANVLVTGGAGFIGSAVVRRLVALGHSIRVADNLSKGDVSNIDTNIVEFMKVDLLKPEEAKAALSDIDYCFHFAAKIGGIGYFNKYPADILRDNTAILSNVLEAARSSKTIRKVVYISSSMVFERTTKFPSAEEDVFSSPPPITHYGFSKLVGEYFCKAYFEQYGLKYSIFRPFNAYGPGEVPENEVGIAHVIPDLIKKIYIDKQYPVEILGDGNQIRAYTFVADLADAISTCGLDSRSDNEDFNVADPHPISVRELVQKIWNLKKHDKPLRLVHLPPFKDDVQKRIPDTKKIRSVFGWKPSVCLDDGLKLTADWIIKKKGVQ
ncbi:MAG: NAD-dependent epimerase/dehydratase family protein [Candidatus Anstonellales archaeon]